MGKIIVMQHTIDHILSTKPDKIRDVEALGKPELIEFDDRINNYFKFE